jgi:hypothetical protein
MSREGSYSCYRTASGGLAVLHFECDFAPSNKQLQRTVITAVIGPPPNDRLADSC